ncbi:MAG: polyprenyl synthetase family protein [Chloroflexi bacterium]|nr:polyprenyl synthetase family protein [Chloroflexota bacterium]
MPLESFRQEMLPAIEEELKAVVKQAGGEGMEDLHQMLSYHLGWSGEGAGAKASGKRVRPLLVLLSTAGCGADWAEALPAAAAVELVHNFSLIHDDIQDGSRDRRGRPTLWTQWGEPQAINAGDSMFALAHMALERLLVLGSAAVYAQAARLLPLTSLQLTQGQYLDLSYEQAEDLSLDDYWPMVLGKTAVLFAACTRLGALVGGASEGQMQAYTRFGKQLGLAFQVHDDLLGIWGEAEQTGKSTHSDLASGKKSLPVLYAMEKGGDFAKRWKNGAGNGERSADEVSELAALLEAEGARAYTEEQALRLTDEALNALREANSEPDAGNALKALADELVSRGH